MALVEKFPIDNEELKVGIEEILRNLETLKGAVIKSADVDQDAEVTIHFEDGRVLEFSCLDSENVEAIPIYVGKREEER